MLNKLITYDMIFRYINIYWEKPQKEDNFKKLLSAVGRMNTTLQKGQ